MKEKARRVSSTEEEEVDEGGEKGGVEEGGDDRPEWKAWEGRPAEGGLGRRWSEVSYSQPQAVSVETNIRVMYNAN